MLRASTGPSPRLPSVTLTEVTIGPRSRQGNASKQADYAYEDNVESISFTLEKEDKAIRACGEYWEACEGWMINEHLTICSDDFDSYIIYVCFVYKVVVQLWSYAAGTDSSGLTAPVAPAAAGMAACEGWDTAGAGEGVAGGCAGAEGAFFLLISRNLLGTPAAGGIPKKPLPPMLSSGFARPPT
jgi:hypothetical protein